MIYKLNEAIEDIKKYYPNIPDNIFLQLIELDPTYRQGSSSAGKYGKWLLNLYNKGNLSEEDFNEVTPLLNQFTTYRNRVQNKDLNSYKSLDALADTLASVIDDDSMLTPRQKVRFLKNVKSGKVKVSAEDDYDVVLETPKFIVYVPNTHEASMKLGKGTDWCTAHENPSWYNNYTENDGKLYIVKNKFTGERWQYSDDTHDFLDENDNDFNVNELLSEDDKLFKWYINLIGFNPSEPYIYNGKSELSPTIKDLVTNVIISDGVARIGPLLFKNCKSLESVTISNSVIAIRVEAFYGCTSLKSLTIPDSVNSMSIFAFADCTNLKYIKLSNNLTTLSSYMFKGCKNLKHIILPKELTSIGSYVFCECSSLQSIKIPENVTNIGENTFNDCKSLQYIVIPDNVDHIGKNAFANCPNLTVYTNNEYVIGYCESNGIPTQPIKTTTESYKKSFRLHIKES